MVNLITGEQSELARALAAHEDVQALWYAGDPEGAAAVEAEAAATLKPVWTLTPRDWDKAGAEGRNYLRHATRSKTIWLPFGALPSGTGSASY